MLTFLSEGNLKAHLDYMKTMRSKHSILEKSLPDIKGKSAEEIFKMPLKRSLKNEILPNLISYELHKTYFSSFTDRCVPCELLRKHYGSESAFCYKLFEEARRLTHGYLYVYKDTRGRVSFRTASDADEIMIREKPLLLLDLFEHAYFTDYGYDYEKYIKNALAHLDFSRLSS